MKAGPAIAIGVALAVAIPIAVVLSDDRPATVSRGHVRIAPAATSTPSPAAAPAAPVAPSVAPADPALLHALGVTGTDVAVTISHADPRQGVTCGTIVRPGGTPTRFVHFATAGLGALDDAGPDFALIHDRACKR